LQQFFEGLFAFPPRDDCISERMRGGLKRRLPVETKILRGMG